VKFLKNDVLGNKLHHYQRIFWKIKRILKQQLELKVGDTITILVMTAETLLYESEIYLKKSEQNASRVKKNVSSVKVCAVPRLNKIINQDISQGRS
jgi:hypothetical protein